MNEEEFVEKLQLTLKSDPQPNLVPFLKVSFAKDLQFFMSVLIFKDGTASNVSQALNNLQ